MNKILVDTTVWIDALNGIINKRTDFLKKQIEADIPIVLCPVIIQEILQGIKEDNDYLRVKEALSGFEVLFINPVEAAYGAARLYRNLRKHGVTIRKSNDCLIAFYAIYHNVKLLHHDSDFDLITQHTTLRTVTIRGRR